MSLKLPVTFMALLPSSAAGIKKIRGGCQLSIYAFESRIKSYIYRAFFDEFFSDDTCSQKCGKISLMICNKFNSPTQSVLTVKK